jgi:hypothetical protein
MRYSKPILRPLDEEDVRGQYPCWSGGVAYGGQCGSGGTAGTSCVTGYTQFAS